MYVPHHELESITGTISSGTQTGVLDFCCGNNATVTELR